MEKDVASIILDEVRNCAKQYEFYALSAIYKLKQDSPENIKLLVSNNQFYYAKHKEAVAIAVLLGIDYEKSDAAGMREGDEEFKRSYRCAEWEAENGMSLC